MKANLLEEGSFDSVVDGCDAVFHTASPFYHAVTDPQVPALPNFSFIRCSSYCIHLMRAETLGKAS